MENQDRTALEAFWKGWDAWRWIPALSLPTLPWTRPFLAIMGLPTSIVKYPEVWTPIYTQAVDEYHARIQPLSKLGGDEYTWAELKVKHIVLFKAFQNLEQQIDKTVAADLERWVRRNFLSFEVESATSAWQTVLHVGFLCNENHNNHIPPPNTLITLSPDIEEIIYYGIYGSQFILNNMMPSLPQERVEETECETPWLKEILLVHQAISQELTLRVLKIIVSKLNEQERSEFLQWALAQAEAISVTTLEKLGKDKYLQVEPPYFDFPSVLDLPLSDEE